MVAIAHPTGNSRRLLRRKRKHMANLKLAQAGERGRRGGGAEHRPKTMRRVAVVAKLARIKSLSQPAPYVITERDRTQQRRAIAPLALGHGENRGHNTAAR